MRWSALAPALFVLLWSTGFIGAKLGVPYVEPFTFLSLRFAFVLAIMLPLALLWHVQWPRTFREGTHIAVAGALMHAGYLGGCFSAVFHGMSAGLIALITGLQPILTAFVAAPVLRERIGMWQWTGLVLGFGGVVLVTWEKLSGHGANAVSIAWAIVALVAMTAGTVYQKRFCPKFDLRSGSVIQFTTALAMLLPLALLTETHHVEWSAQLVFALGWLVLVLSLGAISILYYLIRHGEATRVASLFYLTPLVTAGLGFLIFGEKLNATALAGMVIGVTGVAIATRKREVVAPEP